MTSPAFYLAPLPAAPPYVTARPTSAYVPLEVAIEWLDEHTPGWNPYRRHGGPGTPAGWCVQFPTLVDGAHDPYRHPVPFVAGWCVDLATTIRRAPLAARMWIPTRPYVPAERVFRIRKVEGEWWTESIVATDDPSDDRLWSFCIREKRRQEAEATRARFAALHATNLAEAARRVAAWEARCADIEANWGEANWGGR